MWDATEKKKIVGCKEDRDEGTALPYSSSFLSFTRRRRSRMATKIDCQTLHLMF